MSRNFILGLAALAMTAFACSAPAVAMSNRPIAVIQDEDAKLLPALMADPAAAVEAHKAAGTFTPALAKSMKGYLANVAKYGKAATDALMAKDAPAFYGAFGNLELNKQYACKRLANCRDDGRPIRPGV